MDGLNKKNIFLWALYDFANSIPTVVFFLYFSQWLVIDKGVTDFQYNLILAIGSLLLLITAPVLGSIADKTGREQKYLNRITWLTFICFLGGSLVTLFFYNKVFLAAIFFLLANYLYQLSFVFYNVLLHYIAPPGKWGKISGVGQAGNWLGQICGLLITLPLASGAIYLFGAPGRAQTFLPATILFFMLALPMMLFFKHPKPEKDYIKINWYSLKVEYQNYWQQFIDLISTPNLGLFLFSYFFFGDAIITASNNFPIYLENVYQVSDVVKSMLLGGILVTSAVGAYVSGIVADKIGLKRSMMIILAGWIIILPLIGLAPTFNFFVFTTILMGFFFGSTWTVSRAIMTTLCPKDKLNFGFSFYTLTERAATFLGPLTWGIATIVFSNFGYSRYKIGISTMGVLVAIGFFLMRKVKIVETT
jgi:MFS transporter, UMF1 family